MVVRFISRRASHRHLHSQKKGSLGCKLPLLQTIASNNKKILCAKTIMVEQDAPNKLDKRKTEILADSRKHKGRGPLRIQWVDCMGDSFVGVPLAYIAMNILLAGLLSLWTVTSDNEEDCGSFMEQSQRMASMVSTAAISIVTLTFSLTVLSIQIAAQSYSPRLLDEFLKDPVSKVVISVNLGAYAYCYTVEYFLAYACQEGTAVPHVMIHVISFHMLAILVSFVEFIHFFINGFRIEKILSRAAASSLRAAEALSRQSGSTMTTSGRLEVPKSAAAYRVLADKSGYVNGFRLNNIVHFAKNLDISVRYNYQIGEFVNEGTVLCYVWDAKSDNDETPLEDRVLRGGIESNANKNPWENLVEAKLGKLVAKGIKISKV